MARVRATLGRRRAGAARGDCGQRRGDAAARRSSRSISGSTARSRRSRSSASSAVRCTGCSTRARSSANGPAHLSVVASGAVELPRWTTPRSRARRGASSTRALPAAATRRFTRSVVVREHRATFSLAPGGPPRPPTDTPLPGFYPRRRLDRHRAARHDRRAPCRAARRGRLAMADARSITSGTSGPQRAAARSCVDVGPLLVAASIAQIAGCLSKHAFIGVARRRCVMAGVLVLKLQQRPESATIAAKRQLVAAYGHQFGRHGSARCQRRGSPDIG